MKTASEILNEEFSKTEPSGNIGPAVIASMQKYASQALDIAAEEANTDELVNKIENTVDSYVLEYFDSTSDLKMKAIADLKTELKTKFRDSILSIKERLK